MDGLFSAGETIFETFIQENLGMFLALYLFNLLLALCLVIPRSMFNMWPALMSSRDVETLWIDRCFILSLLTSVNLSLFHRLLKYVGPIAMAKDHPSLKTITALKP